MEFRPKSNQMVTYTVGTYSVGKERVVYAMSKQVLPTVPSPTTVILTGDRDSARPPAWSSIILGIPSSKMFH